MATNIPKSWIKCKLGDVIVPRKKRIIPNIENANIPFIGMDCIKPNSLKIYKQYQLKNTKSSSFIFYKDDILYGRMRSYLNKVWQAEFNGAASAEFIIFPENEIICSGFLKYLLHKKDFVKYATRNASGDRPRVKFEADLSNYCIGLPPLNEQRRIVEKIEEEFGKIDEGVEKLRFALEQIKQYRQAVLKSAFDGKLYKTTEWEEKSLQELTLKIGDVDHKMPKEVKEGVPYISPKDFYGVNGIDFINAKKITKKDYKILSKKIAPNYGDIIFPRYGTIGTLRYVDTEEQFLVSYSCVVIKTINEKAESKYLYYSLLSPQIKSQIQRSIRQTTQANIGIQSIKDFKIKIGIKAEQQQIVKEIEKRLKVADKIEAVIRQNIDKAEQLKQSILKKAFEGRLVPQDPNDEPASVLLEKIKAERKNK